MPINWTCAQHKSIINALVIINTFWFFTRFVFQHFLGCFPKIKHLAHVPPFTWNHLISIDKRERDIFFLCRNLSPGIHYLTGCMYENCHIMNLRFSNVFQYYWCSDDVTTRDKCRLFLLFFSLSFFFRRCKHWLVCFIVLFCLNLKAEVNIFIPNIDRMLKRGKTICEWVNTVHSV